MRGSIILLGFILIIVGAIPVFHVSIPYAGTLLNSLSSMIPGGAGLLIFIGVILFIIGII